MLGVRRSKAAEGGMRYSFVEYEKPEVDMIDDETRQRVGLLKVKRG